MIKKITLTFFFLFSVYNLIIFIFPLNKDVFYNNKERAEDYVFSSNHYNIVTIGSSLIGGFVPETISPEKSYFNLFFPRSGSFTGLEILNSSKKIPELLLVEVNFISKGKDNDLLEDLFHPVKYFFKSYIPSFLEKNNLIGFTIESFKKTKNTSINEHRPDNELYLQLLAETLKEWNNLSDTIEFKEKLSDFKNQIDFLKTQNVSIVFFEIPMDSSVTNSRLANYMRKQWKEEFKEDRYNWIPSDTSYSYQTGDGIHLLKKDLEYYSIFFVNELSKINLK